MKSEVVISCEAAQVLICRALVAQGANQDVAEKVAAALILADADGQPGHGLSRVPSYIEQMQCGKVDGRVWPFVRRNSGSTIEIDANCGFAYPALDMAVEELLGAVRQNNGIAMSAIVGSHHCGVAGHPVEKLARNNFLGLMFANTPKAMHAFGAKKAIFGTNPIAFACPRAGYDPILLDLSLSVVARAKVVQAAGEGRSIPRDWGIDQSGQPTDDPDAVLKGSLNAIGGSKGMALALMVEILAGAFVKSQFGFQASSFFDQTGGPPRVGQLLLCINPLEFNQEFLEHNEALVEALLADDGSRLPGARRFEHRKRSLASGLKYPETLIRKLESYSNT